MPVQAPNPPDTVLDNLTEECKDHDFWNNFKNAAAIIFCGVVDQHKDMRQVRELSFSEELAKTRNMIDSLIGKIDENDSNLDIIQLSLAVNKLENKMRLLKALSAPRTDEEKMQFKVEGTSKEISIDINKLKDAITYLDAPVEEKQASAEDSLTKVDHIDYTNMSEEEYLTKAVEAIGEI